MLLWRTVVTGLLKRHLNYWLTPIMGTIRTWSCFAWITCQHTTTRMQAVEVRTILEWSNQRSGQIIVTQIMWQYSSPKPLPNCLVFITPKQNPLQLHLHWCNTWENCSISLLPEVTHTFFDGESRRERFAPASRHMLGLFIAFLLV